MRSKVNNQDIQTLEAIQRAAHLNNQGACLLAADRPNEAFEAFNIAFDIMGNATIALKQAGNTSRGEKAEEEQEVPLTPQQKKPQERYIQATRLRQGEPMKIYRGSAEDTCKQFVYNQAFLFNPNDLREEVPNAHLSELYTAAVIFNMALSFHQRCEESPLKFYMLYKLHPWIYTTRRCSWSMNVPASLTVGAY